MKKQIIMLCVLIAGGFLSFAQTTLIRVVVDGKIGFGYPDPVKKDKMGYPAVSGIIIPPIYEETTGFAKSTDGLASVKKDGKWGVIDDLGKTKIPFKYEYISFYNEGIAYVELNGKWGFIDETGKVIIPIKYEEANNFYDGLACVGLDGKVGFINTKGAVVIPIKYDPITKDNFSEYSIAYQFRDDGTATVLLNGKCGIIDKKGNFSYCKVIPIDSTSFSGIVTDKKNMYGSNPGASIEGSCETKMDIKKIIMNGKDISGYISYENKMMYIPIETNKPASPFYVKIGGKVSIKIVHVKDATFKLKGQQGFDADGGKDQFAPEKAVKLESITFSGTSNGKPWIDIMGNYISKISVNDIDDAIVAKSIQHVGGDMQKIDLKKLKIKKGDDVTVKVFYNKGGNARLLNGGAIEN